MSNNPLRVSLDNIIPLTEARDHFSQIVNEVQKDKLYILTKGGKPAVAIVDVKYLEDITNGNVNPGHVEQEIQKNPAKVGRPEMLKHESPVAPSMPPMPPQPSAGQPRADKPFTSTPQPPAPAPKPFTPAGQSPLGGATPQPPAPAPKPFTPNIPPMPKPVSQIPQSSAPTPVPPASQPQASQPLAVSKMPKPNPPVNPVTTSTSPTQTPPMPPKTVNPIPSTPPIPPTPPTPTNQTPPIPPQPQAGQPRTVSEIPKPTSPIPPVQSTIPPGWGKPTTPVPMAPAKPIPPVFTPTPAVQPSGQTPIGSSIGTSPTSGAAPAPTNPPTQTTQAKPLVTPQDTIESSFPNQLDNNKPAFENPKTTSTIDVHPMADVDDATQKNSSQSDNTRTAPEDKPGPAQYSANSAQEEPDDMNID